MSDEQNACPECNGRTVEFRGRGLDMQYRICPRYDEPGHKSWDDVKRLIAHARGLVRPSGRFA